MIESMTLCTTSWDTLFPHFSFLFLFETGVIKNKTKQQRVTLFFTCRELGMSTDALCKRIDRFSSFTTSTRVGRNLSLCVAIDAISSVYKRHLREIVGRRFFVSLIESQNTSPPTRTTWLVIIILRFHWLIVNWNFSFIFTTITMAV